MVNSWGSLRLRRAAMGGHLAVVYTLVRIYQFLNKRLPSDIKIKGRALDYFVKDYQEKLEIVAESLGALFPKVLVEIIDDYSQMALGTIRPKSTQLYQSVKPRVELSDFTLAPTQASSVESHDFSLVPIIAPDEELYDFSLAPTIVSSEEFYDFSLAPTIAPSGELSDFSLAPSEDLSDQPFASALVFSAQAGNMPTSHASTSASAEKEITESSHLKVNDKYFKEEFPKVNKELIEAAMEGNLTTVERLLTIESVRTNAHANDNEALRLAATGGHLAVVERLLAIKSVNENAHACDNGALRVAAAGGHLAVVERLLAIKVVNENAHACDNGALLAAAMEDHLAVVFILVRAYQLLNKRLPSYITIQGRALDDFVKDYQEKLAIVAESLGAIFPRVLIKTIDDYVEMALSTIWAKSIQLYQPSKPSIELSEFSIEPSRELYDFSIVPSSELSNFSLDQSFASVLTFSTQAASMPSSHASTSSPAEKGITVSSKHLKFNANNSL